MRATTMYLITSLLEASKREHKPIPCQTMIPRSVYWPFTSAVVSRERVANTESD